MLVVGNIAVIFGLFMLSLSRTYWQVFLSQGVCMGLGAGLLYVPSLALVGLSFSRKRSLAQGIVTSGIAVGSFTSGNTDSMLSSYLRITGGVAYILEFSSLSETKDFGYAVRTMAYTATGLCVVAFPALLKGTSGTVLRFVAIILQSMKLTCNQLLQSLVREESSTMEQLSRIYSLSFLLCARLRLS
jgi:MFS family permease